MSLAQVLDAFDKIAYSPRLLQLMFPPCLTEQLSPSARAFLQIAYDKAGYTVVDLAGDDWKDDDLTTDFFARCNEDVRTEILAFLTLFVHEYTHRIDFLISPFGLQYYVNSLREYWLVQEFFPRILDDPRTVDTVKFMAAFGEEIDEPALLDTGAKELWSELEGIIHIFYAWGDVSTIRPIGKYIESGWSDSIRGEFYPFGSGIALEPVTILRMFHTFRSPGNDKFWYLRPLTIFETKAVINSLMFILHLFGERGLEYCRQYYERVYLRRRAELPQDYFFLLDLSARMYNADDFQALLNKGSYPILRSTLIILSSICWFALQAPPHLKEEDQRTGNPILRLLLAFSFMSAYVKGQTNAEGSAAEILLRLDGSKNAESLYVKPASEIVTGCCKVLRWIMETNEKRTWNPDVRQHFNHIFSVMLPHFEAREPNYVSRLGMPDEGSPILACRSEKDWELTYDKYETPAPVREWFSMRTDLFFNLLKPADEVIDRLDKHFMAFLVPYQCACGQGLTPQWVSRFARVFTLRCGFCGAKKAMRREEMTPIYCE
jgi:hypothetical protein